MVAVLDQTGDVTRREFHRYAKLYDLPTYVKSASAEDVFETDPEAKSTAFADVRNRQFNCGTKAGTWVSYLYFLEKRAEIHPKMAEWTQQRLDRFAESWGITPDIESLQEKNASLTKEHLVDADYMLVWASDHGVDRRYPLRNALEVKTAADWFEEHRDHFVYDDRRTMAAKLLEKANQFGAGISEDLSDLLEKQSGRGTYNPKEAAAHIKQRAALATASELKEGMYKMAGSIESNPQLALDLESVNQMCQTVDSFDRLVKLSGHYTATIPRPEDIFCGATFKTARAAVDESCELITGSIYNSNDFSKLALTDIRDAFGSDIAESSSRGLSVDPEKFAEIASTLPRPDAVMLDRIMSNVGVAPMLKAATAVERPSHADLTKMAAMV